MDNWLELTSIVLGSSVITGFLTYKISNRKQNTNEFISVVSEYKEMLLQWKAEKKELQDEAKSMKLQITRLERSEVEHKIEIINLRNQLMIFEGSHGDVPIPIWLKDTKGVMLFLNDEYEKLILHPVNKVKQDYIGKTDYEFWESVYGKEKGYKIADSFRRNDLAVQKSRKPLNIYEEWGNSNINTMANIIKYPRFSYAGGSGGRIVIGIGGLILTMKQFNEENKIEIQG